MTDRYTKILLTVIAVALSVIAARGLIASAVAQGPGWSSSLVLHRRPRIALGPCRSKSGTEALREGTVRKRRPPLQRAHTRPTPTHTCSLLRSRRD